MVSHLAAKPTSKPLFLFIIVDKQLSSKIAVNHHINRNKEKKQTKHAAGNHVKMLFKGENCKV